jgi:hypothetical protein
MLFDEFHINRSAIFALMMLTTVYSVYMLKE